MTSFLPIAAVAVFFYMTILFVIAVFKKDNSIADIGWGLGFTIVALLTFFLQHGFTARHLLVTALVVIWGMRLAIHIYVRHRGRGEDPRYAAWRKEWGNWVHVRSFFQVFMLQGLLLLAISYVVILINSSSQKGLSFLDICGLVVWVIGFLFESIGDFQLKKFIGNEQNRGRILTTGLWRYTRHPNYFGEATMWWGIFLIALSVPYGWTAIISPAVITFLLLRVSGVILLEKEFTDNEEFKEYKRKTSAFIPWFPKGEGR
jgi:steroid 5-alpha reductase family enzyme